MIKSIFKLSAVQIGLLLILMPFLAGVAEGVIFFISIFKEFEFDIPLLAISFFVIHLIFFAWVWSVSVTINEKTLKINNQPFKISFWFYFVFRLIDLMVTLNLNIFEIGGYFELETVKLVENLAFIYSLLVFASYIYLAYFTGKIIKKIVVDKPKNLIDKFPRFFLIFAFPIGIPLLHSRVRNYLKENKLFGLEQLKVMHLPKTVQQPTEKIENKSLIKKEEINKEDPSRFMPK